MQCDELQHMIVLLEEEARASGYEYSADFLKIAATSLRKEIDLSDDLDHSGKTLLESRSALQ